MPHTFRPFVRRACAATLFLFLLCTSAHAFEVTEVSLSPLQPNIGEPFAISLVVETMGSGSVEIVSSSINLTPSPAAHEPAGQVDIFIGEDGCILGAPCPVESHVLTMPIDAGLPAGEFRLSIWSENAGVIDPPRAEVDTFFAVGDVFPDHVLAPRLSITPMAPVAGEPVTATVAVTANVCGPFEPEFDRLERNGNDVDVFLTYGSGFGGGNAMVPADDAKCTPAVPIEAQVDVSLGAFDPGIHDLSIYITNTRDFAQPYRTNRLAFEVAGDVSPADGTVSLHSGRFGVRVQWTDHQGVQGVADPVPGASDVATLFTFFDPANWELLVKVLDGCAVNGHYWVFTAGASDVRYDVLVTDTVTGQVWSGTNPAGSAAAMTDVRALASCD